MGLLGTVGLRWAPSREVGLGRYEDLRLYSEYIDGVEYVW